MDITVQCGAFADQISQVVAIASRKTTMQVLSSVLVESGANAVSIAATDMEISAKVGCAAQVSTPGQMLVPAKRMADIAKLLPSDAKLRLSDTESGIHVECGRYASRLASFPLVDFPAFPQSNGGTAAGLSASTFSALVRKVRFAILEGDQRYYLAGANASLTPDGRMTLMATDGHRFAIASGPRPAGPDADVLIPGKALGELASMFDGADDEIAFTVEPSHLRFACGDRLLLATRIEGKFPSHDRIVPKTNDKIITVDRDVLLGVTRRVALAASDGSRSVSITVDKGTLFMSAASTEIGDATEQIEVTYDGVTATVRLSAQYMMDFLDAAEPGPVVIEMRDGLSAVLLRQESGATLYRYVLMPIVM